MKNYLILFITSYLIVNFHTTLIAQTFLGTTSTGGSNGVGSIVKLIPDKHKIQHLFSFSPAKSEFALVKSSYNGKYYGVSSTGGVDNLGIISEFTDHNRTPKVVHNFTLDFPDQPHANYKPMGGLTEGMNGKLYGLATNDEANQNTSFIYSYNPLEDDFEVEYFFPKGLMNFRTNGDCRLTMGSDSCLYSDASSTSMHDLYGTLFRYNPKKKELNILHEFPYKENRWPKSNKLLEIETGVFLGAVIYNTPETCDSTIFYTFNTNTNDYQELLKVDGEGSIFLMTASNGLIYGVNSYAGELINNNHHGVIFKFDYANNTYSVLHSFDETYGSGPIGNLVEIDGQKLYGVTARGGYGSGVIFSINLESEQYEVHKFLSSTESKIQSFYPYNSDTLICSSGIISYYDINNNDLIAMYDEDYLGNTPRTGVIVGSDTLIYGITNEGGAGGYGTLYSYDLKRNDYNLLYEFAQIEATESTRHYELLELNGNIFGLKGSELFNYNIKKNALDYIKDLSSYYSPLGTLTLGNDGFFYIPCRYGIYKVEPISGNKSDSLLTSIYIISKKLEKVENKMFFIGSTQDWNYSIYEFDPTDFSIIEKYNFGYLPNWSEIEMTYFNNKLYGICSNSGINNKGYIFEYDISKNILEIKFDFGGEIGEIPTGKLVVASNSNLYGVTSKGGEYNNGAAFMYDPIINFYERIASFDQIYPYSTYGNPENVYLYEDILNLINSKPFIIENPEFSINGTDESLNILLRNYFDDMEESAVELSYSIVNIINREEIDSINLREDSLFIKPKNKNGFFSIMVEASDSEGLSVYNKIEINVTGECMPPTINNVSAIFGQLSDTIYVVLDSLDCSMYPAFYVSNITNGRLFRTDGSEINNNSYITIDEGNSGLLFLPINAQSGSFQVKTFAEESYSYSSPTNCSVRVDKCKLFIYADDKNKLYGSDNPTHSVVYSGFVNGDNESDLDALPVVSTTATKESDVGDYEITVSGGSDNNYEYLFSPGILTINKATINIQATNKSKTYGDDNPALDFICSGFVNGDNESDLDALPVVSTTATKESVVGDYEITVSGGADNNYEYLFLPGILTINKATINIQPTNKSKAYGDNNPALDFICSGFINGDNESDLDALPVVSTTATKESIVGDYEITVSGGSDNNYKYDFTAGKLRIEKALLSVIANDTTKNVNDPNPNFSIRFIGFKNNDSILDLDVTPTAHCYANESSPIGTYEIIVTGGYDNNYELNYINGLLNVLFVLSNENYMHKLIEIYPNPFNEFLHINLSDQIKIKNFQIINTSGYSIFEYKEIEKSFRLDLSFLIEGIYFLKMTDSNGLIFTNKLIKN